VRRDRIDDPAAEAGGRLGRRRPADVRVPAELQREQVEPGVEADDELAPPLAHRLGQTVREGRGYDRRSGLHQARVDPIRSKRMRRAAFSAAPSQGYSAPDSEEVRAS
jgi:hypothetical protein